MSTNLTTELIPTENYAIGFYILFIVIISCFLNLLVILVLVLRRKKISPSDVFIIALAATDIMFSLSIHPMLIATSFGANSYAIFTTTGCNWYGFGAMFFGCLSMVIHGSISLVRCLPIVNPNFGYGPSIRTTMMLLSTNVLYSGIFALSPILGWGRYEHFEYGCCIAFSDPSFNSRSYVITTLVAVFFLPICVCIVCYGLIGYAAYMCKLRIVKLSVKPFNNKVEDPQLTKPFLEREDAVKESRSLTPNPTRRTKSTDEERNESQFGSRSTNQFFKLQKLLTLIDKNMTVMMAMTAIGYLIAWGPFASLCIWEMVTEPKDIPELYRVVVCLFAKSATAYNPFIYFFMFKGFRRDTVNVLKRFFYDPHDLSTNNNSQMGNLLLRQNEGKSEVAASPQPTTKFMNNLDSAVHDHNNQNLESDTRNFLYQCYKDRDKLDALVGFDGWINNAHSKGDDSFESPAPRFQSRMNYTQSQQE